MYIKLVRKIDVCTFFAVSIVFLAVMLRVVFAALHAPPTDSDEATMQLAAIHINTLGEHPVFFYGQNYMGTIEAFVGAVLFRIAGPSVFTMRLGIIAFFGFFLVGLYMLTKRLYSRNFALLTIALLVFGTSLMLERQLIAGGGYIEVTAFAMFLFLISYSLVISEENIHRRKRIVLYALWGFLTGLAAWSDPVIAPYVFMAFLLIVFFRWREIIKWGIWLIILGVVLGAFPLITFNINAPPGADTWTTLVALSNMGMTGQDNPWSHISRTFLVSIPVMTGFQLNQMVTTWPSHTPHPLLHEVLQWGWSMGYFVLLCVSLLLGFLSLRKARDGSISREAQVRACTQIMLVLAALLTIILFIKGGATNIDAVSGARYLSPLWISTPVVLWPLWRGITQFNRSQKMRFALNTLRLSIIFTIFFAYIISMYDFIKNIPMMQQDYYQMTSLEQKLEDMHITRFYTDYWSCARLIFASEEKLICGDTGANLTHGYDRYMPYREAMLNTPNPAFVYLANSDRLKEMEQAMSKTYTLYHSTTYEGYIIIQPLHPIPGVPLYQP